MFKENIKTIYLFFIYQFIDVCIDH